MLAVEDDRLRRCSKSSCCDDAKKAMQKVRFLQNNVVSENGEAWCKEGWRTYCKKKRSCPDVNYVNDPRGDSLWIQ
jgi:hypothetical protein